MTGYLRVRLGADTQTQLAALVAATGLSPAEITRRAIAAAAERLEAS